MNLFEYLNSKSLAVTETKKDLGKTGLWEIQAVITVAMEQNISILDVEMVSNFADIKKDRAAKILPNAQIILMEYRDNVEIISRKSQDNVEIISRKSQDSTPSNPHGSIKDKSKLRSTHVEENKELFVSSEKTTTAKPKKKTTEAPDDFPITERMEKWATENGLGAGDIERETPNFLDHHKAKGNRFACWESAWKTWMRNSKTFSKPKLVQAKSDRYMSQGERDTDELLERHARRAYGN